MPRGALSLEESALVSRAEGLARAWRGATHEIGSELVRTVLGDAGALLRKRESRSLPV